MLRLSLQLRFREPATATVEEAPRTTVSETIECTPPLRVTVELNTMRLCTDTLALPAIVTAAPPARYSARAERKNWPGTPRVPPTTESAARDRHPVVTPLQDVRDADVDVRVVVVAESVRFCTPPSLPVKVKGLVRLALTGSSNKDPEETLMDASMDVSRGWL
jgi:hypothetical protein